MASRIEKDFDFSKIEALATEIERLSQKHVVVGIPESKNARNDGTTNATIAAVHEYGSPDKGIPERSFFRASFAENSEKYKTISARDFEKVLKGELTPKVALERLGSVAAGDVKAYIRKGQFTPLKQETINRKGSSAPLIDTGEMSKAITFEVRDND